MIINLPNNFISDLLNTTLAIINQLILPMVNKIESHPVILFPSLVLYFVGMAIAILKIIKN